MLVQPGDRDEVREQLVRVRRSHPVVQLGHFVEHVTELSPLSARHPTIITVKRPERDGTGPLLAVGQEGVRRVGTR